MPKGWLKCHEEYQSLLTGEEQVADSDWYNQFDEVFSFNWKMVKWGSNCQPNGEVSKMLCKLIQQKGATEVDIDNFWGNPLEYHYLISVFEEVVEKRIEDPRGRLTRLIMYYNWFGKRSDQALHPATLIIGIWECNGINRE